MPDEQLRVGLLVDGNIRRWQATALEQMANAGAEIETVIINDSDNSRISYNLRNAPAYLFIAGARELSVRLLGASSYLEQVPLSEVDPLEDADRINCTPIQRDDFGKELPQNIVDKYCTGLDCLVRFGFGIIRGDVLQAPTYGVLSYHHGDLRNYRGRPAGFWEFMNEEDTIGVTLQQLTDELDAGRAIQIKQFDVERSDTYQDVLHTAYLGSTEMLADAATAIQNGDFNPETVESLGQLYTAPGWVSAGQYLLKNTKRRLISLFSE